MSAELHVCPTCHQQSFIYRHGISKGMVSALSKFKKAVLVKGENSVHTRRDMDGTDYELTKGEYANWTMLRYHGLVAKDDDAGKGYWLLTRRGNQWLKGEVAIPRYVFVLNNEVQGSGPELVSAREIVRADLPIWFEIEDLEREAVPLGTPVQGSLL